MSEPTPRIIESKYAADSSGDVSANRVEQLRQLIPESFCRKWRIVELALFGSVLREDFGPRSDVDVLVTFEADAPWSLWDLVDMRDELRDAFGRNVDLVEQRSLNNPFRRRSILRTKRVIYVG